VESISRVEVMREFTVNFPISLAIVLLPYAALCALIPLGSAISFGGDEGYELVKAFMVFKGFALYHQIWDDQPPLLTILLALVFKLFGPSLLAARLLAATFGALLLSGLCFLIREAAGVAGALFGALILLGSPQVVELCVSTMQEAPAFAIGMLALGALSRWRWSRSSGWLLLTGLLFGVALQIKFTAGIIFPAAALELVLEARRSEVGALASALRHVALLFAATLAAFVVLGWICGTGGIQMLWTSHFALATREFGSPDDYRFSPRLPLDHPDALIGVIVAVTVGLWTRRLREMRLPFVWLVTALFVHLCHRPWWDYYYLHFAIPMAWISGLGFGMCFDSAKASARVTGSSLRRAVGRRLVGILAVAALIGISCALSLPRCLTEIERLRESDLVQDSPLLQEIAKQKKETEWFYSTRPIYAFHAKMPVPPELVVVSRKRLWSGNISPERELELLRRYHPAQMALAVTERNPPLIRFVEENYSLAFDDGENRLYIRHSLTNRDVNLRQ